MPSRSQLLQQVEQLAQHRCEYCQMHQSLQGAQFHLEHIVPIAKGGVTDLENLALACPGCNLRKSDRVQFEDPISGSQIALFHPRNQKWQDHFKWRDFHLVGNTCTGHVTILALDLNHARRIEIRKAEAHFGLFPPELSSQP